MRRSNNPVVLASLAFCAGFLAEFIFQQGVWGLAHLVNPSLPSAWATYRVPPFSIPQVIAASLWGGIFAMVFGHLLRRLPSGAVYWLAWILVAEVPLAAFQAVALVRQGWMPFFFQDPPYIALTLAANSAWGLGIAVFLRLFGVQPGAGHASAGSGSAPSR